MSPLTLPMVFLLLRGELESESHPLCQLHILPTLQTHRENIICHRATALASRAPPPCLGTGLDAAAEQGDGGAHTHTAPALTPGWSKGVICHISESCHTARATSDL